MSLKFFDPFATYFVNSEGGNKNIGYPYTIMGNVAASSVAPTVIYKSIELTGSKIPTEIIVSKGSIKNPIVLCYLNEFGIARVANRNYDDIEINVQNGTSNNIDVLGVKKYSNNANFYHGVYFTFKENATLHSGKYVIETVIKTKLASTAGTSTDANNLATMTNRDMVLIIK